MVPNYFKNFEIKVFMDDLIKALEELVDSSSIENVIISLSDVCFKKAMLLDTHDIWESLGNKLGSLFKPESNVVEKALAIIRSHADNGMTHENVCLTIEEIKNLNKPLQ